MISGDLIRYHLLRSLSYNVEAKYEEATATVLERTKYRCNSAVVSFN